MQTPDLCCCAACRDLGFVGYELLRQIVRDVVPFITFETAAQMRSFMSDLIARIDEEERYRAGEQISHLKEEDACDRHCLGLLCAPFNNANFRCDCEHGRHDGQQLPVPPTMEQQNPQRALSARDWQEECYICYAEDAGDDDNSRLLTCRSCSRVAHKKCVKLNGNDVPVEAEWTCQMCVLEHDRLQHDSRCLKCEMHDYLIDDLASVCTLALFDAEKAQKSTDAATWGAACLESVVPDLEAYHAHMARDANQNMFQPWCFSMVEGDVYGVTDLYDFWAKQPAQKTKTSTCEGMANKGVSVHGRMYTYANPPQWLRDDHPDVRWDKYPSPPEKDGPALVREFRRSWSDSSTQDSYDTAATILVEDKEFYSMHPWIKTAYGSMSDGASNYQSTSSLIYSLKNKWWTVKCTSVEGMGKDGVDANNGREQPVLRQARATEDLTYTKEYVHACNARRPPGNLNASVTTNRSYIMTPDEKRRMNAFDDVNAMKLRRRRAPFPDRSLVVWELFSKRLSERAGKAVGYGRGRVITEATIDEKHSGAAHRLPDDCAKLSFVEAGALPFGQVSQTNPVGILSKTQKKSALAIANAVKAHSVEEKAAAVTAKEAKVTATYNQKVIVCPKCDRKFKGPTWFAKHTANGCGRFHAARLERKRVHDAGTVRSLVKHHDDDLADEAEVAEQAGLDLVTATFTTSDFGWTIGEHLYSSTGAVLPPTEFASLAWTTIGNVQDAPIGSRVRISAMRFESEAPGDFGAGWRSAYYYGKVVNTNARNSCVDVLWSGDERAYTSHVSHIELGSDGGEVAEPRAAVVQRIELGGAAHRNIKVHVGCIIVSVDGVLTPSLQAVVHSLSQSQPSKEKPVRVLLRRPPPPPRSRRGAARSAAHHRPPHDWHDDVNNAFEVIMKETDLERRSNGVYRKLQEKFRHAIDARRERKPRPMLPSVKSVENRMLTRFKNKRESERREAQDKAARALAREAAVGDESALGEIVVSDDEDAPDEDALDEDLPEVQQAPTENRDESDEAVHFAALDGVTVTVLRQRLRESGKSELATVKADALPPGTPTEGPAKSAAVLRLLRERLARSLAAAG